MTGKDLSIAWKRYYDLFGTVPHGTEKQMASLLELIPHRNKEKLANQEGLNPKGPKYL